MSSGTGGSGATASSWPVVGREEEIDLLAKALDDPVAASVVVLGAPGVGKTRLLRETARLLEQSGRTTRWLVGTPSSAVPFGALATYLPADLVDTASATLVGHAVRALSEPEAAHRPLVVVDDAHLLDRPSAVVVGQLMRSPDVDVICAWRSGESSPLEWAVHDEHWTVVELQPLNPADVAVLLDAVLGPPVAPATAERLYEHSQGSGLFLRELIEDAHTTGALIRQAEGWVLDTGWRPGERVMELVMQRIGRRSADEQVVLEALALAEPVALDLLGAVGDAEALVALERARLIEVRAEGLRAEVLFAHPLYGEAVRSRLGLAAARQRKRALADALEATGLRRRGDLLTLARWRLEGGGDLDAEQWAIAARQAIALEAPEAETITRRAVDAGAGAMAWAALGHLRTDARDLAGAIAAFERGAALATNDDERVVIGVARARALFWVADRADDALAQLDRVAAQVREPLTSLPLDIQRISVLVNAGRITQGLDAITTLLADDELPVEARIEAMNLRAIALAFAGRTAEALDSAERLLQEGFALSPTHPELLPTAASPSLVVRLVAGELSATAALIQQFRGGARGEEALGYLAALEGRLSLMQGRVRTALTSLRIARYHLGLTMGQARSLWVEALIGEANAYLQIETDEVTEDELDPGGDLAHRFLVVDGLRARAVAKAKWGDLPSARALIEHGLRTSEDAGMLATTIWLGYEGFRMGGIQFAGSLIDNAGGVAGPIGELFPRHAAAHRADDPNELEATALALGAAGFDLYASDCAADASRSFRRHGLSSGATRCAALAQQLRERCEGAHGTDLAELTEFAALTPREKDVTLLAAKGLTNREIAEVTSTSLRTVEGHLLRAYRKLGVSSRAELASHFSER